MEKQKKQAGRRKRGTLSWVMEFAGRKRSYFGGSILLAILGVAASFLPYLLMADIVGRLLAGTGDWAYYLRQVILMGVCWIARVALHSTSTTLSHVATFTVLGGIRKQLTAKLSRIPLGFVLDDHSAHIRTSLWSAWMPWRPPWLTSSRNSQPISCCRWSCSST